MVFGGFLVGFNGYFNGFLVVFIFLLVLLVVFSIVPLFTFGFSGFTVSGGFKVGSRLRRSVSKEGFSRFFVGFA